MAEPSGPRIRRQPSASYFQRHDFVGSFARFWQRSYAADYVGLTIVVVLYTIIQLVVTPFHRLFSLDDISLQYPHAEVERVSVPWLFFYALGVPLTVLIIWAVIWRPPRHKVHVTFLGLFTSVFLTIFLTDVIKNAVGRPRPDLLARCMPAKGTPQHKLVGIEVCTETGGHTLHDGWRSFPSGHSSFSFSGLGFIAFFFAGQLHVLHPASSLPELLLTIVPLIGAVLVAISRLEDYRHDVWDVIAGSSLGLLMTWLTYRRYYPHLRNSRCETPWPSKAEMLSQRWSSLGGRSRKDEEARLGMGAAGPSSRQRSLGGEGSVDLESANIGPDESDEDIEGGLLVLGNRVDRT